MYGQAEGVQASFVKFEHCIFFTIWYQKVLHSKNLLNFASSFAFKVHHWHNWNAWSCGIWQVQWESVRLCIAIQQCQTTSPISSCHPQTNSGGSMNTWKKWEKLTVNVHGQQRRHVHCPALNTQIFEPLSHFKISGTTEINDVNRILDRRSNPLTGLSTPDNKISSLKTCFLRIWLCSLQQIKSSKAHLMFFYYGEVSH